ncbi:hypothetical protein ACFQX7_15955 [Luedemannella flava]
MDEADGLGLGQAARGAVARAQRVQATVEDLTEEARLAAAVLGEGRQHGWPVFPGHGDGAGQIVEAAHAEERDARFGEHVHDLAQDLAAGGQRRQVGPDTGGDDTLRRMHQRVVAVADGGRVPRLAGQLDEPVGDLGERAGDGEPARHVRPGLRRQPGADRGPQAQRHRGGVEAQRPRTGGRAQHGRAGVGLRGSGHG